MNLLSCRALGAKSLALVLCFAWQATSASYLEPVYDRLMPQGAKTTDTAVRSAVLQKLTSTQAKQVIAQLELAHASKVAANGGKDIEWTGMPRDTGGTSGRPWGNHEMWLEQCFNGVKPTYDNLVRWQYSLILEATIRGGGGQEVLPSLMVAAYKPVVDRRIGIRFDHLEPKATDERLAKLGLAHLVGKGLEGIEFEQNKGTIFLANKGTEACVVHVTGSKPRFRRLLDDNGIADDWVTQKGSVHDTGFRTKQGLSLYPARFAWPGSVNLRLVESTWKGKEFKAWWLMKGSYGIDDESVSRVQAYHDDTHAWVSKNTASPSDLARLGLKHAMDPFPFYPQYGIDEGVLANYVVGIIPWVTSESAPLGKFHLKTQAGYSAPIKLAPDAWQRRMTSAGLGGRLPEDMLGSDSSGLVMRNKEATMMVGGRLTSRKTTWALSPMSNPYAYGQSGWERRVQSNEVVHPDEEKRITLLPPKNGVGMAQGVAEYLSQTVLYTGERMAGVRRHYMGSAIKDPAMALWIEAERITDKQAQALLAPLSAKPTNPASSKSREAKETARVK